VVTTFLSGATTRVSNDFVFAFTFTLVTNAQNPFYKRCSARKKWRALDSVPSDITSGGATPLGFARYTQAPLTSSCSLSWVLTELLINLRFFRSGRDIDVPYFISTLSGVAPRIWQQRGEAIFEAVSSFTPAKYDCDWIVLHKTIQTTERRGTMANKPAVCAEKKEGLSTRIVCAPRACMGLICNFCKLSREA